MLGKSPTALLAKVGEPMPWYRPLSDGLAGVVEPRPGDHSRSNRRRLLAGAGAGAPAPESAFPAILRAQAPAVKTRRAAAGHGRALSYSGQQGKLGAQAAIDELNAAGGIKGLGKIDVVFGDAQSTPEGGTAEVEKMNAAGVAVIVGGYSSSICLAASQAASRYDLPYLVDVGVADNIMTRGLKNTFRFGPGFGVIAKTAIDNLVTINDQAGKPAKTVMIVNEDLRSSAPASPNCSTTSCRRAVSRFSKPFRIRRRHATSTTSY